MQMSYAQYCRLGVGVGASEREVVRLALRMLARGSRRGRRARATRHVFVRSAIRHHSDARLVFERVRRGY